MVFATPQSPHSFPSPPPPTSTHTMGSLSNRTDTPDLLLSNLSCRTGGLAQGSCSTQDLEIQDRDYSVHQGRRGGHRNLWKGKQSLNPLHPAFTIKMLYSNKKQKPISLQSSQEKYKRVDRGKSDHCWNCVIGNISITSSVSIWHAACGHRHANSLIGLMKTCITACKVWQAPSSILLDHFWCTWIGMCPVNQLHMLLYPSSVWHNHEEFPQRRYFYRFGTFAWLWHMQRTFCYNKQVFPMTFSAQKKNKKKTTILIFVWTYCQHKLVTYSNYLKNGQSKKLPIVLDYRAWSIQHAATWCLQSALY